MKTVFKVDINIKDLLRDYQKYSKNDFLCPVGYDSISDFIKICKEWKTEKTIIVFNFDEPMWFNLGDTVLLNNIYYKVISKTFHANTNTISYYLNFE